MASFKYDSRTVSRCTAVQDEFNDIDDVFWSVVNSLPPDSPFIRRLTAMFQETDPDKELKSNDEQDSESEEEPNKTDKGDGDANRRVLRSQTTSPAASKTLPVPQVVTRSQDDAEFYDKQATDPRVQRRPYGAHINYSAVGDEKYLISSAPAYFADYETGEAPLLALPTEVYAALLSAYKERFPDKALEVLGVSVTSTLVEPPRDRVMFDADSVKTHMRNKTELPEIFEKSLQLTTWEQVQAAWARTTYSLDEYMGVQVAKDGTRKYNGARPLVFMEKAARTAKYFVVNIHYNHHTYCIACRHKTYLHDRHPWCMVCTVLAGYWPCVGGKFNAVCLHCKDYSTGAQSRCVEEWKRIYDEKTGFIEANLFAFRSRLPVPIVTQFDATISTIVRDLWKNNSAIAKDPVKKACITAYHIKRPSIKQSPKPDLEEGEVPPPSASKLRRSKRRSKSTGPPAAAAATAPEPTPDTDTDTDDTEDAMLQSALHLSLLDTHGSPATKSRGRKSEPGPSAQSTSQDGGGPAKKQRKSDDKKSRNATYTDYLALPFPWWYVARALMGQSNFSKVHYGDNEDGCVPDDASTVNMQPKLAQIWRGELPVYCRYNEDGSSWGLVYAPRGSQYALPVPKLPVPTAAMLPKIAKPVSFTFVTGVPVRFREMYDLRTVEWPQFVEERIAAFYRPALPHLNTVNRWMPLLPDDYHDPTVTLEFDVANLRPVINAPPFARSWKTISKMDAASLQDLLKQYFHAPTGVPVLTHTHIWWRRCAASSFVQHDYQPQRHLGRPMLLPLHEPEDPVVPTHLRRPTITGMDRMPRPPPLFAGLTPTAVSFLKARSEEQAAFVGRHDAAAVHNMTYRSQRMRLYTGPYLENQDAAFTLEPLQIPDSAAWGQRLSTPLDFTVAYPVTDVSLCYSETLERLMIYQLSHREQSLAHLDFAFQQLVQIIAVMNPSFLSRAQSIADTAVARQWHLLQDDYATATELLHTTVHQRRQGFLSFAPPSCPGKDRVEAVQRPIVGETRILVPRVPAPPPPPRPQSPPPSGSAPLKPTDKPSVDVSKPATKPTSPPAP